MGGFLGIGRGQEHRDADDQRTFEKQERDRAAEARAVALAERKSKKGQDTAKVKLGAGAEEDEEKVSSGRKAQRVSGSLGIGGLSSKKGTGTQI